MNSDLRPRAPDHHDIAIGCGTTRLTHFAAPFAHAPVAVVVPDLGVPAARYESLAHALTLHGVSVITVELRGFGASSARAESGADWGCLDLVDDEIDAAMSFAAAAEERVVFFIGHGLGGRLALLHRARFSERAVEGVVVVASASPATSGCELLSGFTMPAWSLRARDLGHRVLSAIGMPPKSVSGLPHTLASEIDAFDRTGHVVVARNGGWHAESALRMVDAPLVALRIAGDRTASERAMRALCDKTSSPVLHDRVTIGERSRLFSRHRWLERPEPVACAIAAHLGWLGIARTPGSAHPARVLALAS